MLDATLKTQLKSHLENLKHDIELAASLGEDAESVEMQGLLSELAGLSGRIRVIGDGAGEHRVPSFSVARAGQAARIRFAGIPMGHEFTSLVLALLQAGGHPPRVDQETIEQIAALEGDFEFETFISLSCQNCPDVVQALNLMAVLNPRIRHTMIDGALFQSEVEQRKVMAVPSVFVNGQPFGQGRMTLKEILAKLDSGSQAREAKKLAAQEPFDVLVVGGGPAGAAAAIYAARKGVRTGIVSERFGGQVMDTLGIENFISVKATEGPKLVAALEEHVREYEVEVMDGQRAESLKAGALSEVSLESGATLKARSVILATGARWREIGVPGEREYRGKGVAYCPHCDGPLFKGKRVAVIGGGNSGVEAAIDLAGIVGHVTLLEFAPELRADAVLQAKLKSLPNVDVRTSAQTTEVIGSDGKVSALAYTDRESGTQHELHLEGVFVQIGLLPNTDWLKGSVALSGFGEIEIDARCETSVPGVFAAGDATTVPYKQIVIAMGEGSKAALSAFDYLIRSTVDEQEAEMA